MEPFARPPKLIADRLGGVFIMAANSFPTHLPRPGKAGYKKLNYSKFDFNRNNNKFIIEAPEQFPMPCFQLNIAL